MDNNIVLVITLENRNKHATKYWLLTRPGILRLLAILYENGAMPLHHIPRYGIGVGTTYRSAHEAAILGFVNLYPCSTTKCAKLTEKGKKIASKIIELLDVANNV